MTSCGKYKSVCRMVPMASYHSQVSICMSKDAILEGTDRILTLNSLRGIQVWRHTLKVAHSYVALFRIDKNAYKGQGILFVPYLIWVFLIIYRDRDHGDL